MKELEYLNNAYDDANPDTFDVVPDGKYQVFVETIELTRTKKTDLPMLAWMLNILGPDQVGQKLFKNNVIATAENAKWLKGDLQTCGVMLPRLSDLGQYLDQLLDIQLEVTVKTTRKGDDEYHNIYINRKIGAMPSGRLPLTTQGTSTPNAPPPLPATPATQATQDSPSDPTPPVESYTTTPPLPPPHLIADEDIPL